MSAGRLLCPVNILVSLMRCTLEQFMNGVSLTVWGVERFGDMTFITMPVIHVTVTVTCNCYMIESDVHKHVKSVEVEA